MGYAALLASSGPAAAAAAGRRSWMPDAAWLGGLSCAAALAWRGLAAHPTAQLVAAGYLAAEGLFWVWSKLR